MLAALSASATSFAPARAGTMKMTVDMPASDVPSTPAPLVTEDMMRKIGDYGFDPLGLGKGDTFVPFREAEIKHGRSAMLATVATGSRRAAGAATTRPGRSRCDLGWREPLVFAAAALHFFVADG